MEDDDGTRVFCALQTEGNTAKFKKWGPMAILQLPFVTMMQMRNVEVVSRCFKHLYSAFFQLLVGVTPISPS